MLLHDVRDDTAWSAAIPVTIIGGCVGAGKTTFINHLLAGSGTHRLAVVTNEFGSTPLDRQRIAQMRGTTVDLADGCACCTHAAELVLTLASLCGGPQPPTQILIEANGASDPRRIASVVGLRGLRFDALVAIADAEAIRALAGDPDSGAPVRRQLVAADIIVLNKIDLVTPSEKDAVRDWVSELVPGARIVEASHGRVPTELVVGPEAERRGPGSEADGPALTMDDAEYARWVWVSDEMLDGPAFRWWAANLPDGVLRSWGAMYLEEDPSHRYVFHLVGARWALVRDVPWGAEHPRNHLVLLARPHALDHRWLDMRIARCVGHHVQAPSGG